MVKFSNPYFFYLFILLPLLIAFYWFRLRYKKRQIASLGEPGLIEQLTAAHSLHKVRVKNALLFTGILFLILALVGFEIGTKYEKVKIEGVDIVIALDISTSMNAEDIQPSRLEKAKHEIGTLLGQLSGDRVALVIFAGNAFIQCPMTGDYSAVRLFLDALETSSTTSAGTNFTEALETASQAFVPNTDADHPSTASKVILILSDGEDHDPDSPKQIKKLIDKNIRVYAVGIGTPNPVPIPIYDENGNQKDFKKHDGSVVTTRLEEGLLREFCEKTGGMYYASTGGETEIKYIYQALGRLEKAETSQYQFTEFEDRFQYFLLTAFVLLFGEIVISERKKR